MIEADYKRFFNSKRKYLRVRKVISKIGNGDGTVTVRGGKRKIYCTQSKENNRINPLLKTLLLQTFINVVDFTLKSIC